MSAISIADVRVLVDRHEEHFKECVLKLGKMLTALNFCMDGMKQEAEESCRYLTHNPAADTIDLVPRPERNKNEICVNLWNIREQDLDDDKLYFLDQEATDLSRWESANLYYEWRSQIYRNFAKLIDLDGTTNSVMRGMYGTSRLHNDRECPGYREVLDDAEAEQRLHNARVSSWTRADLVTICKDIKLDASKIRDEAVQNTEAMLSDISRTSWPRIQRLIQGVTVNDEVRFWVEKLLEDKWHIPQDRQEFERSFDRAYNFMLFEDMTSAIDFMAKLVEIETFLKADPFKPCIVTLEELVARNGNGNDNDVA